MRNMRRNGGNMKQKKLDRLRATADRLIANANRNRALGSNECDALLELAAFALAQVDRLEEKNILKDGRERIAREQAGSDL